MNKKKMKKVPYYHSMHQQLWIYLSNPYIVDEWVDMPKFGKFFSNEPITVLKEYVLDRYAGCDDDYYPNWLCFPCDAAEDASATNWGYKYSTVTSGCYICPLKGLDCTDDNSLYIQANRCLYTIFQTNNKIERKERIFKFCSLAQQIAFYPLYDKNVEKFYNVM